MRKIISIWIMLILLITTAGQPVYAFSTRHHLINIGKNLINIPLAPLKGIFIKGPHNIKEIYRYEVYGNEKPEKNGWLIKKLFAVWSAPAGETRGVIDGMVEGVDSAGKVITNTIDIVTSD
ncbi:MAG: hypothetical protein GY853_00200 [PVC group bacterium]|nr:hypothetical protein [PVC group bacterium]